MDPVTALISNKTKLPSPPLICIKILDLVRRDDFTFKELAHVIGADPSLSAKLLKVANTTGYIHNGRVNSVEKAVAILGVNVVKIIALSFIVYTEFQSDEGCAFDTDLFWRRSLTSAVAAEQIATSLTGSSGDLFLIALLQDIGMIIMNNLRPHDYQQMSKASLDALNSLHTLEHDLFGFDHQILGAELFKSWNFPEELYLPIQFHHSSDSAPQQYRKTIEILEVANLLSSFYNDNHDVDTIRRAKQLLINTLGVEERVAYGLIESVAHKSREMFSVFEFSDGQMKPLSQILQEANEELGDLYDSYELIMLELKQAKEKAVALAKELHKANERYRDLAYKDDLTKIYNFRFFHEALDREIDRSRRYGREFSLVLIDLDYLKKINDTHGHFVGNQVIVAICRIVQENVRGTDIFARLGGDELGIILPETDVSSAYIVAEQIRLAIESNNEHVPATISIGISNFCPDKGDLDRKEIFNTADNALYMAKNNGRNCTYIFKAD